MAYGRYSYDTVSYGHGAQSAEPTDAAPASLPSHANILRAAIERAVRGSTKDDPHTRAFEDGPVPGSATAQD